MFECPSSGLFSCVVSTPTKNVLEFRVTDLDVAWEWEVLVLAGLELAVVSLNVLHRKLVLRSTAGEEVVGNYRDSVMEA